MMHGNGEPSVSVVTPVFNGGKYLAQCIESVLVQTYGNWEYVIVNNCSTDDTLEIAEAYARRDTRIRIHDNIEFLELIKNFNHALRRISPQSKYCKVVHADDWLFPECLSSMVALAEEHPTVGIVGAYSVYGTRVELDGLRHPSTVVRGREMGRLVMLGQVRTFGSPTAVMIRSDEIRRRRDFYDETELHADRAACYEVLRDSDYGFVHQVLTYSRVHDESVTSTVCRPLHTGRLTDVSMVKKYGRCYLSDEEYNRQLGLKLDRYYEVLARNLFRRKATELWAYHRSRLEQIGEPLKISRLAKALVGLSFDRLLNPKRTIESVIRKLRSASAAGKPRIA
jgi:glycosyltransferase involved in cell wall biosynthesis